MSVLSFFSRENEKVSLLVDIGNGSITGAFGLFKKGQKPEILYSLTVPFVVSEKPNADKLVENMSALLENLLQNITGRGFRHKYWQNKSKKLDGAIIAFSSPWFVSRTKRVTLSEKNSFIITRAFIDEIIKKEETAFKNDLGAGRDGDQFEIMEKSIVHTKINGYILENSLGKKTKSLDAYVHMSAVSKGIINKVDSIIQKNAHIPREEILVQTFPLVSFTVIRDLLSASSDFLIMDITGEVTDLSLVQDDVIKQSVSIPSGRNFIIRQVAKTYGVSSEIAESNLHLYIEEKLDGESLAKMEEVLVNVEKEWSIYLENGLSELSPSMALPGNIYLTADSDVAPIYINFLNLSKTDSTAMFRKGLNINHINEETTKSFFKADSTVKTNEFIVLLAIFYNKIIFS